MLVVKPAPTKGWV